MNGECVRLSVPAKAEYLVTARLTAASVAGQAGFDVDDIDDVKTACSEACLLLLHYTGLPDDLTLEFCIEEKGGLHMTISASHNEMEAANTPESEFSAFMLRALMDEVAFSIEGGRGTYSLFKAPLDS